MPDKKLIDNLSNNSPILSNSLSDSEIKKALECCNTKLEDYQCPHCPLLHKGCKKALIQNALDLINRQKAEVENIQRKIAGEINILLAERDVAKNEVDSLSVMIIELQNQLKTEKAEIERLQEKSREDDKLLNDRVQEAVNAVSKANQKYVDSLEKRIEDYKHLDVILNTAIDKLAKDLKAEAYKEFAERLKEHFTEQFCGQKYDLIHGWINNLLEELVGEDDESAD